MTVINGGVTLRFTHFTETCNRGKPNKGHFACVALLLIVPLLECEIRSLSASLSASTPFRFPSADFQKPIQECIAQAYSQHQAELESLLTLWFQTFREVPVIGEEGQVSPFPGGKQSQKKVSSKAA
jgi:hypothetical protein